MPIFLLEEGTCNLDTCVEFPTFETYSAITPKHVSKVNASVENSSLFLASKMGKILLKSKLLTRDFIHMGLPEAT